MMSYQFAYEYMEQEFGDFRYRFEFSYVEPGFSRYAYMADNVTEPRDAHIQKMMEILKTFGTRGHEWTVTKYNRSTTVRLQKREHALLFKLSL